MSLDFGLLEQELKFLDLVHTIRFAYGTLAVLSKQAYVDKSAGAQQSTAKNV